MRAQEHEKKPAELDHEKPKAEVEQETEARTKFAAGGNVPPVGAEFKQNAGSADLAFEESFKETSHHQRELKEKVAALVTERHDGDYKKAFEHYKNENGTVSQHELVKLMSDANVGDKQTRSVWASQILARLNVLHDREIECSEFESGFTAFV